MSEANSILTASTAYIRRYIDDVLDVVLADLPAVMITGPRGCGKTTSALQRSASVLRLDDPEQARLFKGQPDAHVGRMEPPVLIDEWQEAPESLGVVKRAVDGGRDAGHFLITGSVRGRHQGQMWPGTGRVTPLAMYGFTVGELESSPRAPSFLDWLWSGDEPNFSRLDNTPDLLGYVDHALRGGFPEVLRVPERSRSRVLDGYVDQLVHRDVQDLALVRAPERMASLLRAVAINTAGVPTLDTLVQAAGADAKTVRTHLDLLEELRIIERVPAWHANQLKRLTKSPKYYVIDPALAARQARMGAERIMGDSDFRGRLIDTFVASQLRPLAALADDPTTIHHLRMQDGRHEVDLVLEGADGRIVAIEVKAAAVVGPEDARHLTWFRDEIGDAFVRGIVFHTGERAAPLGDRIWAMPIAALWR